MKRRYLTLTLALLGSFATHPDALAASPLATVALPAPKLDGNVSLESALKQRRSVRNPTAAPLSLEDAGQLCWAAQGLTDDKGHRTAPSARGLYPLQLYLLAGSVTGLSPGLYRYDPAKNALVLLAEGDRRADFERKAVGQVWIANAPAIFVISGTAAKMANLKERGPQFMFTEVGLAAQGFLLEATALRLGSTFVGGFRPREAREALALPDSEEVLAVLPVGHLP